MCGNLAFRVNHPPCSFQHEAIVCHVVSQTAATLQVSEGEIKYTQQAERSKQAAAQHLVCRTWLHRNLLLPWNQQLADKYGHQQFKCTFPRRWWMIFFIILHVTPHCKPTLFPGFRGACGFSIWSGPIIRYPKMHKHTLDQWFPTKVLVPQRVLL